MSRSFKKIHENYTPDISPNWDTDFKKEWTAEEQKELLIAELGYHLIVPKQFYVLGKVYKIPEKLGELLLPQEQIEADLYDANVCKLLAYGSAAFKDDVKFPAGQEHFIGQWYRFSKYAFEKCKVGEHMCVLMPDTSLREHIADPYLIDRIAMGAYI